jgi:phospholipid/cholesterol/gamma-HCH transport system ATP-binding protein
MPETPQPVLRFENVSLWYDDAPALDDVSFEMYPGETHVILGAAGSGKTSLLKTALGLIKPDRGRVYVFGRDITLLDEDDLFEIRRKMGVLFQEGGLFDSLTVEDNVAYPVITNRADPLAPERVRDMVEETLQFVELGHTLDKFPSELSGGMRRRVGIARAAVTDPPLVLYDSPTAGLDPITANTIIALIVKERDVKGTTTAMVTHRYQDGHLMANFRYNPQSGTLERISSNGGLSDIRTTFVVMREGRLVFKGTQQELEISADPYISKFVMRL